MWFVTKTVEDTTKYLLDMGGDPLLAPSVGEAMAKGVPVFFRPDPLDLDSILWLSDKYDVYFEHFRLLVGLKRSEDSFSDGWPMAEMNEVCAALGGWDKHFLNRDAGFQLVFQNPVVSAGRYERVFLGFDVVVALPHYVKPMPIFDYLMEGRR